MKNILIAVFILVLSTTVQSWAVVPLVSDSLPKYLTLDYNKEIKGYGVIASLVTSDKCLLTCCQLDITRVNISKLSADGTVLWEQVVGNDSALSITNLAEIPGVGYDILGYKYFGSNTFISKSRYAVRLGLSGEFLREWAMYKRHTGEEDKIIAGQGCYFSLFRNYLNTVTDSLSSVFRKYDSLGNQTNEVFYDSIYAGSFYTSSFFRTNNNGFGALIYLFDSDSTGTKTTYQFWLLDSSGKKVWTHTLPEIYEIIDIGLCNQSSIQTHDGNFIVITCSPVINNNNSIIFRRYNGNGILLNERTFSISKLHTIKSVEEMPSGDLLIGGVCYNAQGTINSEYLIARTSSNGKLLWSEKFGDPNTGDAVSNLNILDDNTFFASGYTNAGISQFETTTKSIVMKVSDLITSVSEQSITSNNITLFPNPTSTTVTISGIEGNTSIHIINSVGMEVISKQHLTNNQEIDVSNLPSGLYFVRVSSISGIFVKPIAISR